MFHGVSDKITRCAYVGSAVRIAEWPFGPRIVAKPACCASQRFDIRVYGGIPSASRGAILQRRKHPSPLATTNTIPTAVSVGTHPRSGSPSAKSISNLCRALCFEIRRTAGLCVTVVSRRERRGLANISLATRSSNASLTSTCEMRLISLILISTDRDVMDT